MKYLVTLLAVACSLQGLTASSNEVAKASNTFANNLYQKVASKDSGNVLVCPISLHVALGLVLQGAGNTTATELASTLGFSEVNDCIKDNYKSLLTGIKDNTLKIATKLYPAANYELSTSYVSLAQQYFLSDVEGVDYSKPVEAANKINKYVEENTNNKIHNLISPDSITDATKLIIINAVHFQATWKKTFRTAYDDYFKVSPTEKVLTKMMSMTDYFHYKEDAGLDAKVLKMDYTDGGYSMLFVLPNKEDGLSALEDKLVHTNLDKLLEGMSETKVEVTIPKFKLEKTIDLNDILKSMGIKQVFSSNANLNGIASGDKLYVSSVIQKTFINVHENGTEAAAATGFVIELLSASIDSVIFSARWPFHFILVHSQRPRTKLFEGRLVRLADDTHPQESNINDQNNDEEKIHFTVGSLQNEKTNINSYRETNPKFKPNLINNEVTISPAPNYPHQPYIPITQEQNIDNFHQTQRNITQFNQSNTKDSFLNSPDYNGNKPLHQSQNVRPVNQNSNNELLTRNVTTQFHQSNEEGSDIKYPDYVEENPKYQSVNVKPVTEYSNILPELQHVTSQSVQPYAENNEGQNHGQIKQNPYHQSISETANLNLNNKPQTQHTTAKLDLQHTENNYEENKDHVTEKPHHQSQRNKPVNLNSKNSAQTQHITTEANQPHPESDGVQHEDYSGQYPHKLPNRKPYTENSNILTQVSPEDYRRRSEQFALQLREYYQQSFQIPRPIPFQRVGYYVNL